MKITGTRSYILVEFDYRTIKIAGELTTTPAFYAYINSIKNWEPPYENMEVTNKEIEEIIKKVTEYNNPAFPIYFE
ncbi:hypothetical protein A3860_39720 [Niastella vici]|uniref:Immunity protein 74 n=1 Tax=Niastella vici TaxID=1703345 RepID=A0A1V9FI25_9BACT|nr:Imm74 family immunity protein [Niastella vici]OQP57927.1 hypothetical protein A3860_39720 [Niastella vici]